MNQGLAVAASRRAFLIAVLLALTPSVAILAQIFLPLNGWYDRFDYVVGRDFSNFWMAGRLAIEGRTGTIYDLQAYLAEMRSVFLPAQPMMNFSYPPYSLPLLLPLGLLSYPWAYTAWMCASLAALWLGAFGTRRVTAGVAWPVVLFLAPCVLFASSIAQATLLLACLFVIGMRLVGSRPMLAGILLGLLAIKPQLAALIGLSLLVRREWRCALAAGSTAAMLALVSLALFGTGPWHDYLAYTVPYQARVLEQPYGFVWVLLITPYAWLVQVGMPIKAAFALHGLLAVAIAGLAMWWSEQARRHDDDLATTILALGSVLVTPYSLVYDLVIPTCALIAYLAHREPIIPASTAAKLVAFIVSPIVVIWLNVQHIYVGLPIVLIAFWGAGELIPGDCRISVTASTRRWLAGGEVKPA